MKWLLCLIWLFALIDLALTLRFLTPSSEGNPLAVAVFAHGACPLIAFKLAFTATGTRLLWLARRRWTAKCGAGLCLSVYAGLMVQWGRLLCA